MEIISHIQYNFFSLKFAIIVVLYASHYTNNFIQNVLVAIVHNVKRQKYTQAHDSMASQIQNIEHNIQIADANTVQISCRKYCFHVTLIVSPNVGHVCIYSEEVKRSIKICVINLEVWQLIAMNCRFHVTLQSPIYRIERWPHKNTHIMKGASWVVLLYQ